LGKTGIFYYIIIGPDDYTPVSGASVTSTTNFKTQLHSECDSTSESTGDRRKTIPFASYCTIRCTAIAIVVHINPFSARVQMGWQDWVKVVNTRGAN